MSERDDYPTGVPCWVEGLHHDVAGALDFYGPLMGWEFEGSGGDPEYFVARLRGRDVAGFAAIPAQVEHADGVWMTHVAVDSAAEIAEKATAAGGTVLAGPLDVSPAGKVTVIADPAGAGICAWEPGDREGAQLLNEAGAWSMSTLNTADADRATRFYGELFGWQAEAFGPPEAGLFLFRLPGYVGGTESQPVPRDVVAVVMPLQPGDAPRWSVDFWVADCKGTAAKAEELGGRVVVAPHDSPPSFIEAVVADPQGATLSVSQLLE